MNSEKSVGCIIVNNENKVLVVYEKFAKFWGFPKGHVEANENEVQTATREVKEEVGLDVVIDTNYRYEINYLVKDGKVNKTVVFYKASLINDIVKLQEEEILDYKWCIFDEVNSILGFDNLKEVFKKFIDDIKDN